MVKTLDDNRAIVARYETYLKEKCNYTTKQLDKLLLDLMDARRERYYKDALEFEISKYTPANDLSDFQAWDAGEAETLKEVD